MRATYRWQPVAIYRLPRCHVPQLGTTVPFATDADAHCPGRAVGGR